MILFGWRWTLCNFFSETADLLQIVANNRNGLDVDKYDYLQRDSMYCNTKISVDIKRIFSFVKVPCPNMSTSLCGRRGGLKHVPSW